MSIIIGDTQCPKCAERGRDKTGNHLILFDDGGAYCNRCGYQEDKDTFTKPKVQFHKLTPEEAALQCAEVKGYTCTGRDWDERGLKAQALDHFGFRHTVSEEDGITITGTFIPVHKVDDEGEVYLSGYKTKYPEGRYAKVGDCRGDTLLIGQDVCPNRGNKLFITEGEPDMAALYTILRKFSQPDWVSSIAVVSLKNGSGGAHKELSRQQAFLDGFKEIILCFDKDDAGREAVKEVCKYVSGDIFSFTPSNGKDMNESLLAGDIKNTFFGLIKASKPKPAGVVTIDDIMESVLVRPKMGLSWPWEPLTKLTYGIQPARTYCIGAAPKIGKTDFEYELVAHLIVEHGETVMHFDFENPPKATAKRLAGKFREKLFHKPGVKYNDNDLVEGLTTLRDHWIAYDHAGSRDWTDIKNTIKFYASQGVRFYVLDPLTALISKEDSSKANDMLNLIMTDIAEMNVSLGITFFLFSHVNPPKTGKPHEEGGRVLSSQFTGSRAMEKWTHTGIGIERDRLNEDADIKNTSTHRLLYDRDFGESGSYQCTYNSETGRYLEKKYDEVKF